MGNTRSAANSLYASVPSKLNLMNYAAPSTSPTTPRASQFVGLSEATPSADEDVQSPVKNMNIVGGMPATAPSYDFTWPPSNSSSSQSLSDVTPPPKYTALPPPSEQEKERAKEIVSSPIGNGSAYAAFVKQFCFVQSPTPSPNQSPPLSGSTVVGGATRSTAGSAWRGLGDSLDGLYGGAGMRSDSPMLTTM